jgi:hypothetical protein
MNSVYDDIDVEITSAFHDALIRVMQETCAMMRLARGAAPDAWQAGRCYIENLAEGPVFNYGSRDDYDDGLGDFAVVFEPRESLPVSPGQDVHYVLPSGSHRRAIVIEVWRGSSDVLANLRVLWEPGDEKSTYATESPVVMAVRHDERNKTVDSWHLPEKE